MSNKSRNTLWIIAGMYLAYTGYNLFQNVVGTDTNQKVMFMIFAVLFVGVGVFLIIYAFRSLYKNINAEDDVEVDSEDAAEGAREAEESLKKLAEQAEEDVIEDAQPEEIVSEDAAEEGKSEE